ncbi:MAG TPA: hypothetical protein GXX60_03835 [Anaerolineaceae bacterium]|nr:hypothetical protein [Anaerolineaceae bacterium]
MKQYEYQYPEGSSARFYPLKCRSMGTLTILRINTPKGWGRVCTATLSILLHILFLLPNVAIIFKILLPATARRGERGW